MSAVSQTISTLLASDLRERVTFQRELLVSDTIGGGVRAFEDVVSVWAQLTPQSVGDVAGEVGIEVISTFRIRIRYRSDLTPAMRLLWQGRTLTIASITDIGARREALEIIAREGGV